MNSLSLIIEGKPQGKQRARKGKHGNWYNPQSDTMQQIQKQIKEQLPESWEIIPKHHPVKINMSFFFSPAKAEKNKNECDPYCKKPDIDNLEKFVEDILSGIVFYDDNQIYAHNTEKRYTVIMPMTEIEVLW